MRTNISSKAVKKTFLSYAWSCWEICRCPEEYDLLEMHQVEKEKNEVVTLPATGSWPQNTHCSINDYLHSLMSFSQNFPSNPEKKKTKVLSGLSCSSPIVRQHCLYGLYQNWKFLLPHAITFGQRLCKNFHRTIFSLSVFFIRKICGLSLWDDNVRKKYSINLFLCWLSTPDIF